MQDGYTRDGRLIVEGEVFNSIGGPLPRRTRVYVNPFKPVNAGAVAAMGIALDTFAEHSRWFDAGMLATFRNWSNRR